MFVVALFILSLVHNANAQSPSRPDPQPNANTDESVAAKKGFRTKILEVRYRDPRTLASVLSGLSSKETGSLFETNKELRTIIVRDYPEIVAAVEDALARLDKPEQLPANYDLQIHLIAASRSGSETEKSAFPDNLLPVVKQLQSTFKYKGYRYITTFMNRVKDDGNAEGNGSTDMLFPIANSQQKTFYQYRVSNIRVVTDGTGKDTIQIGKLYFEVRTPIITGRKSDGSPIVDYQDAGINTELGLREGEMVVVGTTNVGGSDEAVIVVVLIKRAG